MSEILNIEQDILDLDSVRENLSRLVDEVNLEHTSKVIIKDNKPAALLINISDYQDLQDRLTAIELQIALYETKEAEKRGELISWEEQALELGIELTDTPKPDGYDQLVPERYRNAS